MVTLLVGFLSLVPITIVALFFLLAEYLDWHGRIEILEKKHRKMAHFIKNRPFRLVLLLGVFGMLAADWKESLKQLESEPPVVRFAAPKVPAIESANPEPPESPNSLRRRTMKLADDLEGFYRKRRLDHPPFAAPDPNAPPERQTVIRVSVAYDQETEETCLAKFKDRSVGIVQELKARVGVVAGWTAAL